STGRLLVRPVAGSADAVRVVGRVRTRRPHLRRTRRDRVTCGRFDMAILVRLDEQLHARRMTLTELAARIDITIANLSILKTGKAKAIRFSTLEAICAAP